MKQEEQKNTKYPYIAVLGPTASGKSSLAFKLAKEFSGEIVSCDSVQLYKGFDIGSAKATEEEQIQIKHHMIDILEPEELFDAAKYATAAKKVILGVIKRGRLPILVGGTGLYYRFLIKDKVHFLQGDESIKSSLKSLTGEEIFLKLKELDPKRAKEIHENDRYRLVRALEIALASNSNFSEETLSEESASFLPELCFILDPPRKNLHDSIEKRTHLMLKEGLLEEVRSLEKSHQGIMKPMTTIGYKEAKAYLEGSLESKEELLFRIICATRQYAKRQVTFFKKINCDYRSENPKEDYSEIAKLICRSF